MTNRKNKYNRNIFLNLSNHAIIAYSKCTVAGKIFLKRSTLRAWVITVNEFFNECVDTLLD